MLVVRNDITRDNRLQKEARALRALGHEVWCVGIVVEPGQRTRETQDYGEVLRVLTTRKLQGQSAAAPRSTQLSEAEGLRVYGGWLGALRHFLGRVRENVLLQRQVARLKPDLVVCHDPDTALAGLLQHRLHATPLGYDAREIWTEVRPDAHWLYKSLYGRVERRIMRRAAYCMTVNDAIAAELERRYGVTGVATVYNGSAECLQDVSSVHTPVRLLFQGSFASDRNLETLVRSMQHLRGRAILSLQGFGEMEEHLHRVVDELDLGDVVRFVDACAPRDVVRCASEHDVGVICHLPTSLNHRLAAPNKLFDYMGAGLAIAGSDLPVIASILKDAGCGVLVDPSTPETLAAGLQVLVDDPVAIERMKRASAAACIRYSWEQQSTVICRLATAALGDAAS